VNVQLFVLLPPLEQAPDHIASRPFDTVRLMDVPTANDADPVLPVATLMPAGADETRSPLRPLAVTVRVADCGGGGGDADVTVRVAVFVTPFNEAEIVTGVEALTPVVEMAKTAVCEPVGTTTLAGTAATPGLALASATDTLAVAAAARTTAPCAPDPPETLVGLSDRFVSVASAPGVFGVTVSVAVRVVPL
jgi:hypothetical protein